jgi:chromosome partitioning protein
MGSPKSRRPQQPQRIYALCTHKGGVGKTTTCVNLAAGFAAQGRRVLLVDLDPQGNASDHLGLKVDKGDNTPAAALMLGFSTLEECVVRAFDIDVVASGRRTVVADAAMTTTPEDQGKLREVLRSAPRYDVVLIDCPPGFGALTLAALRASDGVIVPLVLEYYSASGLVDLFDTIEIVRQHNPALDVSYIFPHRSDLRVNQSKDLLAAARAQFADRLLETCIRRDNQLSLAPSEHKPIFHHAPKSNGASDYRALTEELIARGAA